MDAADIKNRLSHEDFVCLHVLETCFQIKILDIENSVCYHCFETLPEHLSYGVIRKFSSLEQANQHYESLLKDPDPIYVMKPDGPLYRKHEEDDLYMVRYSRVFETYEHWHANFTNKNRSDADLNRSLSEVGPALASRYQKTGSVGNILKDVVFTEDGQVFFWNWAPGTKKFKKEIRQLRTFVEEIKKLATDPDRLDEFVNFLTSHVLSNKEPRKELSIWLFHYPVFMTEQGGVRFLEVLNKVTCDTRTGVKHNAEFRDTLQAFDNQWKTAVTTSSDDALKAVLNYRGAKYDDGGYDLPRFAFNCVKHYSQNAIKENAKSKGPTQVPIKELSQTEVVEMLNSTTYFKNFLEISFQALYRCMEVIDDPTAPPPLYNSEQIMNMFTGGKLL
ncbi:hypothetical protein ACLB2K_069784 [Fragaria x ananassa]